MMETKAVAIISLLLPSAELLASRDFPDFLSGFEDELPPEMTGTAAGIAEAMSPTPKVEEIRRNFEIVRL